MMPMKKIWIVFGLLLLSGVAYYSTYRLVIPAIRQDFADNYQHYHSILDQTDSYWLLFFFCLLLHENWLWHKQVKITRRLLGS